MLATTIPNTFKVLTLYPFEGYWRLELACEDYDALTRLPDAVECEGRRFGRTGWNSDRGVAYYSTRQAFATGI